MLPSYGYCQATYLLVRAAKTKDRKSKEELIVATRKLPTVLAQALAFDSVIDSLIEMGLVNIKEGVIQIDNRLSDLCTIPNMVVFGTIAIFILSIDSPKWLPFIYSKGKFRPELMPIEAESAFSWLSDLREGVLFEAWKEKYKDDSFSTWLGELGESCIMEIERRLFSDPLQVSRISNIFGFDILSLRNGSEYRIEVKCALENTAGHLYLSRNEYEKSQVYAGTWFLYQVVFDNGIVNVEQVTKEMILVVRYLEAKVLPGIVPIDLPTGTWMESSLISVPDEMWKNTENLLSDWTFPGYQKKQ